MSVKRVAGRIYDQCPPHRLHRLFVASEILKGEREAVEKVWVVGLQLERFAVSLVRLSEASHFAQASPQIVPGIGEAGPQFDRAAIRWFGLGKALQPLQRVAVVAVCLG